jgi:hypothetical protein
MHCVHVYFRKLIHAMNDDYAPYSLTDSGPNLVFWPYRQDNGGAAVTNRPGHDPVRTIIAEMTDPATDATLEERRETLSWCLRTFLLPPERRVALETRLAALRTEGHHLRRLACRPRAARDPGERTCAP